MTVSAAVTEELSRPAPGLRAAVVVPARDEEERIGACLDALAGQEGLAAAEYEVIVVLDACLDGTAAAVEAACHRHPDLALHAVPGPGRGAGPARAIGMGLACERLEAVGVADALLASTDADSAVAPDWLARQLEAIAAGVEAIGGDVVLDAAEAGLLPAEVIGRREADLERRALAANHRGPAQHPHFSGASIGLTPRAYRAVGGIGELAALEDQDLEDRLAAAAIPIHRLAPVRVVTSARVDGRADRGLARDLALGTWLRRRSYDGGAYSLPDLAAAKNRSVAVVLPSREVAATLGPILDRLEPLRELGLLDELLVVDADSADGSAEVARSRGAEVLSESSLRPDQGPCLGKGDAMWRAAQAVDSELLVFLDADTADFKPRLLTGLLGPVFEDPALRLVKGAFRRPFAAAGGALEGEGGRVTELVARPLLNLHFPELAGFAQPLAGEIAIDRALFGRLAVPVGYGVEVAMMIDCLRLAGLDALAQSDLGSRQNCHQSLRALSRMATEVTIAVERRREGAAPRPDVAAFRPRTEPGAEPEVWRLQTGERPPFAP